MPKKVIVAVHGIGEQIRYATIRQVLTQFCQYHDEVASIPLGNFHVQNVNSLVLSSSHPAYPPDLQDLAFAEVYWADIAREVVNRKFDLEDAKPWVQTIVGRVRRRQLAAGGDLDAKDQRMLEEVLTEMLQTVDVLDRLFFLTKKMGLFSFDLKRVLTDFLGDVQIVADFKSEGKKIGDKFSDLLDKVHKDHMDAEIYLVAHSEGTVVTLLGLLTALCDATPKSDWIRNVRGLMTLGSPIDKHLILWPELFAAFGSPRVIPAKAIEWRNYYDHGDPVGFELDTARARFTQGPWKGIFNFSADDDHGFTRYFFPGKAHVDYWEDEEVFGHFIQTVVYKNEKLKPKPDHKSFEKAPATRWRAQVVSWVAPYLGALALLVFAVHILYKAIGKYIGNPPGLWDTVGDVGAIVFLLAGVTVAARIPRLTRVRKWHWRGFAIFVLSMLGCIAFPCLIQPGPSGFLECCRGGVNLGLLGSAVAVLVVSLLLRKARPKWGMATLLVPGAFALAYLVLKELLGAKGDLWPVLLAAAFFLYAWWLAALVFDLVFVWHRYIRYSKEGQYLWDQSSSTGEVSSRTAPPLSSTVTT